MLVEIKRFEERFAEKISRIICRNFLEINSKDYPMKEMRKLSEYFDADRVLKIAEKSHSYMVLVDGVVVGCGSIAPYWNKEDESFLRTIFVVPELHGKGIGKKIIETLENDEYFLRASRIEIPASITACGFYTKLGYNYKNGVKEIDDEGHYKLEKFNQIF